MSMRYVLDRLALCNFFEWSCPPSWSARVPRRWPRVSVSVSPGTEVAAEVQLIAFIELNQPPPGGGAPGGSHVGDSARDGTVRGTARFGSGSSQGGRQE